MSLLLKKTILGIGLLAFTCGAYSQDSTAIADVYYDRKKGLFHGKPKEEPQFHPTNSTRIFEKEDDADFFDQAGVSLGNALNGGPNNNVNPQAGVRTFQWQFYFGSNQREVNKGYFIIRNSFTLGSFEFEPGKNVSEIATELAGTEIMNPYGGMFSMTIGQKKLHVYRSRNERLFHWEFGGKFVSVNKSLFLGDGSNQALGGLPLVNGFAEYSYALSLTKASSLKSKEGGYLLFTLLGGFNYAPIFSDDHVYNLIFQDEYGNPAKPYGLLANPEFEAKLGKLKITAGGILRWPDAHIFGFQPRWYFSISNGEG